MPVAGESVSSCTTSSSTAPAAAAAGGGCSESTTSSRDCSPSRSSPFGVNVASPVVLRRGARGYGFSLTAIRVFYGDSGYFTLHHMISVCTLCAVDAPERLRGKQYPLRNQLLSLSRYRLPKIIKTGSYYTSREL